MINVSEVLRMAADTLEKSQSRVTEQREKSGREVDPQAISDALYTLGATGVSIVKELIDSIPERPRFRNNSDSAGFTATDVEGVVNQLIARLGLVEESELAALRKRIADLEALIAKQN